MLNLSVFQVILLASFAALAISGILIFALVVGGNTGSSIGPVVVWGTEDAGAFSAVLRQASETEPRLAQVSYVEKDPATYATELTNALASGAGPDIFLLRQDAAVRDEAKVIPIPYEYLSRPQFEDIFVEAASPFLGESGMIGIPVIVDPLIMYWNRDMLESAGFATPPKYWDEFSALAQRVTKKSDTGSILKSAVAFGEYRNVDNAKDILSLLILQAGGTITARDSTGKLAPTLAARTAGPSQATESAARFYTEFTDPSKVHYSWSRALPGARAAFTSGDLALYFGYASEAREIARANPNLNFASAPVPQIRSSSNAQNVARVYALAISRTSQNPNGATVIASLIADSTFARGLSIALGLPSARRNVLAESSPDKNVLFESQALIARSWVDPEPEKTNDMFRAMIESVTSGSARLTEAISRANQEMARIIGNE